MMMAVAFEGPVAMTMAAAEAPARRCTQRIGCGGDTIRSDSSPCNDLWSQMGNRQYRTMACMLGACNALNTKVLSRAWIFSSPLVTRTPF